MITPKPWKFEAGYEYGSFDVRSKGGALIARVWSGTRLRKKPETLREMARQNAEAIVLLPDLIEACKEMADCIEGCLCEDEPPTEPLPKMVARARQLLKDFEETRFVATDG